MKCIQCRAEEKDGKIKHKKGCSDYYRPDHTTEVKDNASKPSKD